MNKLCPLLQQNKKTKKKTKRKKNRYTKNSLNVIIPLFNQMRLGVWR